MFNIHPEKVMFSVLFVVLVMLGVNASLSTWQSYEEAKLAASRSRLEELNLIKIEKELELLRLAVVKEEKELELIRLKEKTQ